MLPDRDMVVKVPGDDPTYGAAGERARGEAVTVTAEDVGAKFVRTAHRVRCLLVIHGYDLLGLGAQADVARAWPYP
ncbi:hypothetical protein [Streptomyces sp. NPDC059819]|uniref:hypothetical protein n=1 Tax=Streptomyces sp. NPDC059819 TaxID=3346963 RepID=UPI00364AADA6